MTNEPYHSRAMLKLRLLLFLRHNIFAVFLGDFLGWSTREEDDTKIDALTRGDPASDWKVVFAKDFELTDAE